MLNSNYNMSWQYTMRGHKKQFSLIISLDISQVTVFDGEVCINGIIGLFYSVIEDYPDSISFTREASISIWSDKVYNLLDASICMYKVALIDDSRENISEEGLQKKSSNNNIHITKPYDFYAQWSILQSFINCDIILFSRPSKSSTRIRHVTFLFNGEGRDVVAEHLSVDSDELLSFSVFLYDCYNSIQSIVGEIANSAEQ
jgi:hypothetical protein